MKMARKKRLVTKVSREVNLLRNIVFFLNVFLALLIIGTAWLLLETAFGTAALFFGFLMLLLSTFFKVAQMW